MSVPEVIPVRARLSGRAAEIDWLDVGGTDRTLPFLRDRVAAALAMGRTIDLRDAAATEIAGTAPPCLVLHAGRCGSTLLARALAQLRGCHLVSEPDAVNDLLGPEWRFAAPALRAHCLAQVLAALGRAGGGEARYVLKLSSWNALAASALPADTRRIYLFRAPEEILVSLAEQPAQWMRRADAPPAAALMLGIAPSQAAMAPLQFAARVIGRCMETVANAVEQGGGQWLLIDYRQLPDAIFGVARHFDIAISPDETARIGDLARTHAKHSDGRAFTDDTARKQAAATPAIRALAERWIAEPYRRLEQLR